MPQHYVGYKVEQVKPLLVSGIRQAVRRGMRDPAGDFRQERRKWMMLTWTKKDGTWGLKNFDVKKLPGEVYGAVCKLHDYEKSGMSPDMAERVKEILDYFGSEDEARRCMVKLQEYERIGLTPGQITEMDDLYAEKCREVARISDIENANERKWILCSERMPEVPAEMDDERCPEFNVTIKGAAETTTLKCGSDGTWFDDDGYVYPVIAWQPLPEPYRPGQKTVGGDYKQQIMKRFMKAE